MTKDVEKKKLLDSFSEWLDKNFGGSKEQPEHQMEITKSVDSEQRMAMFVVLEPDTVDLHGDIYSSDEVEKACNSFNTHSMKANLFHKIETEKAKIIQSFISPSTFQLDSGKEIKKGTWLQWWHFPENDEVSETLWKSVKTGKINGVSIGAKAMTQEINDE